MPLKKLYLLVFISSLAHQASAAPLRALPTDHTRTAKYFHLPWAYAQRADSLYQQLHLANAGLEKEVFLKAYKGYL
jgi:hypothetical protein